MKPINLMPRIPLSVKYFVLWLCIILLLFGAACAGILQWHAQLSRVQSERSAEYGLEAAKLQALENKTRIKPEDQNLNALLGEWARLNATRREWTPVLQAISAELPDTARLKTAEAQADALKLTVQFVSMEEAGRYELRLARNPLFQQAGLTVIEGKSTSVGNADLYEEQLEVKLAPIQK